MVKTYSLKQDGATSLSPHFQVREFAASGSDTVLVDEELVEGLEKLFDRLDCSKIVITSGYRPTESGSQHALGKAADINCWHMENGKEVRYQGREILLAAEDVGFRGIGWVAGSAASRAAVHLDTRPGTYRFDEANGNRMVKDNSWYAYFGVDKPETDAADPPDILYQVYAVGKKWLTEVVNYGDGGEGYAGWPKCAVQGIRARLSRGSVEYRVHIGGKSGRWLPWVRDYQDYAGLYGTNADGVQMRLVGLDGYAVEYRVAAVGRNYYAWVRDAGDGSDGYAGSFGKAFDKLQCRIVRTV